MNARLRALLDEINRRRNLLDYQSTEDLNLKNFLHVRHNKEKPTHYDKESLYEIAKLKSPRRASDVNKNEDGAVEKLTRFAFSDNDERTKFRILCALDGVGPGVASAILAWTWPDRYGVLDIRAWNTLNHFEIDGFSGPKNYVSIDDWPPFLAAIRDIAAKLSITPQQTDIWLYHYDKLIIRRNYPIKR